MCQYTIKKFLTFKIVPVLEAEVAQSGRPLLIIAEDVDGQSVSYI